MLLWFVLFVISLSIPDGGKTASVLAVSLILSKKKHFTHHKAFAIVLSIINMLIGIVMWIVVVMLIQMP